MPSQQSTVSIGILPSSLNSHTYELKITYINTYETSMRCDTILLPLERAHDLVYVRRARYATKANVQRRITPIYGKESDVSVYIREACGSPALQHIGKVQDQVR